MSSIVERLKADAQYPWRAIMREAAEVIELQVRVLRQIAESDGYACSICGGEAEHKAGCELAKAIKDGT